MKKILLIVLTPVLLVPVLAAQDFGFGPAWPELSEAERAEVMAFGEEFKDFMGRARSHMWFVREGITLAESEGFQPWSPAVSAANMVPGSRWYAVNRDRKCTGRERRAREKRTLTLGHDPRVVILLP